MPRIRACLSTRVDQPLDAQGQDALGFHLSTDALCCEPRSLHPSCVQRVQLLALCLVSCQLECFVETCLGIAIAATRSQLAKDRERFQPNLHAAVLPSESSESASSPCLSPATTFERHLSEIAFETAAVDVQIDMSI